MNAMVYVFAAALTPLVNAMVNMVVYSIAALVRFTIWLVVQTLRFLGIYSFEVMRWATIKTGKGAKWTAEKLRSKKQTKP